MSFVIRVVDQGASVGVQRFTKNVDKADAASVAAGASVAKMGAETRVMGMRAMAASAALFGLGHVVSKATMRFGEFQLAMKATQLVTASSTNEMDRLGRQIKSMAGSTEFKPTELAEGIRILGQAGLSAGEVREAMVSMTEVATAGMLGMKEATELTINVMRGFKVPVHDLRGSLDKLTRITQLTPLAMEEVSTSLGFASASASAFNQNLDSTIIALGILKPITKTASKAGTAFRAALQAMFRPQGVKALKRLGVASVDSAGNARDLIEVIQDVALATKTQIPQAERQAFLARLFGIRGMQLYSAVLNAQVKGTGALEGVTLRGAGAIRELRKQIGSANGTTGQFAQGLRETYLKSLAKFGATVDELSIEIGKQLTPAAKFVTDQMRELFETFLKGNEVLGGTPIAVALIGTAVKGAMITFRFFKDITMSLRNAQVLLAQSLERTAVAAGHATAAVAGTGFIGPRRAPVAGQAGFIGPLTQAQGGVPWHSRRMSMRGGLARARGTLGGMRSRLGGMRSRWRSDVMGQHPGFGAATAKHHRGFDALGARYGAMPLGQAQAAATSDLFSPATVGQRRQLNTAQAAIAKQRAAAVWGSTKVAAGKAAAGLGKMTAGVTSFLGPLGVAFVAFESISLAVGSYQKTVEELDDTEQKRIDRMKDQAEKFGSVLTFFAGQHGGKEGKGTPAEVIGRLNAAGLGQMAANFADRLASKQITPTQAAGMAAAQYERQILRMDISDEAKQVQIKKIRAAVAQFASQQAMDAAEEARKSGKTASFAVTNVGEFHRFAEKLMSPLTDEGRAALTKRISTASGKASYAQDLMDIGMGANLTGKETAAELLRLRPAMEKAYARGRAVQSGVRGARSKTMTLTDEETGEVTSVARLGTPGLKLTEAVNTQGGVSAQFMTPKQMATLTATMVSEGPGLDKVAQTLQKVLSDKTVTLNIEVDNEKIRHQALELFRESMSEEARKAGVDPSRINVPLTRIMSP